MPRIVGFHHLSLSVTDRVASAEWYCRVLGFEIHTEVTGEGFERIRLRHPDGAITVTLTQHDDAIGAPFSERQTGLDHLAFELSSLAEVEECRRRFAHLGVEHSEVRLRDGPSGRAAILAFRDPDRIQLEVFAVEP